MVGLYRIAAAAALTLCGCGDSRDAAVASPSAPALAWCAPLEIATGGGERGPWRQNESRYDYIDDPTVALDSQGTAYVAWVDQRRKDVSVQAFGRDGKPRLDAARDVSRSPLVFSWLPRVALSERHPGEIYVLWQEIVFSGGSHGGDIFFARSRDGGASFERPLNLSRSVPGDGKGRINRDVWHNGSLDLALAPDGALYAAWTEYDGPLWLSRSVDRGASFSTPLQPAPADHDAPARAPALAVAPDGTVHLAWTVGEDESADIRIATSRDGGRTFGEPRIVERTRGYSDAPKIAVDRAGTLHLVYAESAGGPFDRYDVRYLRSRDGGGTFDAAREVSKPQPAGVASASFPALAIAGDAVYVLWETYPDPRAMPRGLALAVSSDGGATFSAPAAVPGSVDAAGGFNGSQQGLLMRKLAVNDGGDVAVVNSSFKAGGGSRVWLMRARTGAKC